MDQPNYTAQSNNNLNSPLGPQAIRTQVDFDGDWDQFWREYIMLNPTIINDLDAGWIGPPMPDLDMTQAIFPQPLGLWPTQMPLSPPEQFIWPPYINNPEPQLLLDFVDMSLTPPWTDPSTSNSSPSATSSRTSLSSASTELYPCRVCGQSFAKRCLLK
jgi:hypothetical protein